MEKGGNNTITTPTIPGRAFSIKTFGVVPEDIYNVMRDKCAWVRTQSRKESFGAPEVEKVYNRF
jgi:hypothetical protein